MPLTYSISNGIALAFIVYVLAKVVSGKMNELNPAVLIIAGASLLHFIHKLVLFPGENKPIFIFKIIEMKIGLFF